MNPLTAASRHQRE